MLTIAKAMFGMAIMLFMALVCIGAVGSLVFPTKTAERPAPEEPTAVTFEHFEEEARSYLGDCSTLKRKEHRECLEYQRLFVDMYVKAMTTDFLGALYTIGAFDARQASPAAVAVPRDPARSCAWARFLSLTTAHNPVQEQEFHNRCDELPGRVRDEAEGRFHDIIEGLNLGARPPPMGWRPKIAGLAD